MHTVPKAFLEALANWLTAHHFSSSSVFVNLAAIRSRDMLPLQVVNKHLEDACALTSNPNLSLHVGTTIQWRHLGALGHMLRSSRTLEELLNTYIYYERLFYGKNIANVQRSSRVTELYWQTGGAMPEFSKLALSAFTSITRHLVNSDAILRVGFPFPDDGTEKSSAAILNCKVLFDADFLSISYDQSKLGRELDFSNFDNFPLAPGPEILSEIQDIDFRKIFFEEITSQLHDREGKIERIADKMHLSTRTLQRRLAPVQGGLRGALSRIRMSYARHYLYDPSMSLSAIAVLLGYSEQSALQNAFKKYYGITPGEFRKQKTI